MNYRMQVLQQPSYTIHMVLLLFVILVRIIKDHKDKKATKAKKERKLNCVLDPICFHMYFILTLGIGTSRYIYNYDN